MTSDQALETARLRLTRPQPSDVDAVFRIHSDPRTYSHRPDLVMRTRDEAAKLVQDWCQDWKRDGIGYYVVRTLDGPTIGFTGVRRKVLGGQEVLNLYYRFAPEAQGHGYAKEAAAAAVASASANQPDAAIVAIIDPSNAPSIRLATALGLSQEPTVDGADHVVFRLRAFVSTAETDERTAQRGAF